MVAVGLGHRPGHRVRDGHLPQRRGRRRPAGHRPGAGRAGGGPPPGHLGRLPQGLPVAGPHRRRRPAVVLGSHPAVFPAGRGRSPRGARRLGRCVDRADRGAVPGAPRASRHHTRHRCPPGCRRPLAAGLHRHRRAPHAAGPRRRKGPAAPAAAEVIAALASEWDGLARHRDLPQLPLDNNTAQRALRTPVIGRKNFYGSGARWAAHLPRQAPPAAGIPGWGAGQGSGVARCGVAAGRRGACQLQ